MGGGGGGGEKEEREDGEQGEEVEVVEVVEVVERECGSERFSPIQDSRSNICNSNEL